MQPTSPPTNEDFRRIQEGYQERWGWHDPERHVGAPRRGLSKDVVEEISYLKSEPDWMRKFRFAIGTRVRVTSAICGGY